MDFARARYNMIESQVRTGSVIDPRVIAAMSEVPREVFVPGHLRDIAYIDEDLAIGADASGAPRHLMEPLVFARMLQLADIDPEDCVLDVGCASGYSAAVLSKLAQSVIALEQDKELAATAGANLEALGCVNAVVVNGPHAAGYGREAPYDVIVLNGRVEEEPQELLAQLKDLGRLVAVFGPARMARIRLWTRRGEVVSWVDHFDANVPLLAGFGPAGAARAA